MHPEIQSQELTLDRLFAKTDSLFKQIATIERVEGKDYELFDTEMRSEIVKHLCVRVSAYLEQSVKRIVLSYAESKVKHSETLVNYFKKREYKEDKSRNANMSYIENLLGDFNSKWREDLVNRIGGRNASPYTSVDTVVKLRHKVAHEGGASVQITLEDVTRYYQDSKQIIKELFSVCADANSAL